MKPSPCLAALSFALAFAPAAVDAQTTQVTTEYLMTLHAPLDAPQAIDPTLVIYRVMDGGWVKGPKLNGTLLAPGADWLRVMPGGSLRLDVRATIKTDDGALVYLTYGGVISQSKEAADRMGKGEVLTAKDLYFITTPQLQTAAEKYAWLNHVQCVGKVVEVRAGAGGYVRYDIFVVR